VNESSLESKACFDEKKCREYVRLGLNTMQVEMLPAAIHKSRPDDGFESLTDLVHRVPSIDMRALKMLADAGALGCLCSTGVLQELLYNWNLSLPDESLAVQQVAGFVGQYTEKKTEVTVPVLEREARVFGTTVSGELLDYFRAEMDIFGATAGRVREDLHKGDGVKLVGEVLMTVTHHEEREQERTVFLETRKESVQVQLDRVIDDSAYERLLEGAIMLVNEGEFLDRSEGMPRIKARGIMVLSSPVAKEGRQ